jgi:transposase-like protein
MGARKKFTPEFKREAVLLVESGSRSASELARSGKTGVTSSNNTF